MQVICERANLSKVDEYRVPDPWHYFVDNTSKIFLAFIRNFIALTLTSIKDNICHNMILFNTKVL